MSNSTDNMDAQEKKFSNYQKTLILVRMLLLIVWQKPPQRHHLTMTS